MIKSQKKAANSYNPEIINSYILNWPLKRIVIDPVTIGGGKRKRRRIRPRLPPPSIIPIRAPFPQPTPTPRGQRPLRIVSSRRQTSPVPAPRILSRRPTPAPRNNIPRPIRQDIADFINTISDYYRPEVIAEFQEKLNDIKSQINPVKKLDKALNKYLVSAELNIFDKIEPRKQFQRAFYWIERYLRDYLNKNRGLKFSLAIRIRFYREKIDENGNQYRDYVEGTFDNVYNPQVLTNSEEIKEKYDIIVDLILEQIAKWLSGGSDLTIEEILNNYINIAKYVPLGGGSYIDLPEELKNSQKGLINIKNNDDKCVIWNLIRDSNPRAQNPQRITLKDRSLFKNYDLKGINFPCKLADIKKLEDRNKKNINIFVYEDVMTKHSEEDNAFSIDGQHAYPYYIRKEIFPYYISEKNYSHEVNMLLIEEDGKDGKTKRHYVYIKDKNKLLSNKKKRKCRMYYCMRCMHGFIREDLLKDHEKDCNDINAGKAATRMPQLYKDKNGKWRIPTTHFKNHNKKLQQPFTIYADFEAILEKLKSNTKKSNSESYTEKERKHITCGYGYKLVCCYDKKYNKNIKIYREKDVISKFIQSLLEEEKYCKEVVKNHFNKPLVMTEEDEESFKKEDKCHICEKKYKKDEEKPVRDHCHITGKYRGSAHNECNLNYKISADNLKIQVVFHNLRGYDGHLIIQEIGKIIKEENKKIELENKEIERENADLYEENKEYYKNNIDEFKKIKKPKRRYLDIGIIPKNTEQYLTFSLGNLSFIDSAQFLIGSLSSLTGNLRKDCENKDKSINIDKLRENFKHTSEYFKDDEELSLATIKGIYPYSYMDSFEKFNETKLPEKFHFFDELVQRHIKDKDYNHALKVWEKFKIKNMGEYHDLYLKIDVLLLADIFENFRSTCKKYYKLDPQNYLSSPSLSWDASLKRSGVYLDQIIDINMLYFIERGKRGGITSTSRRWAKANNKYLSDYDPNKKSKYIIYLDANNLYGWAMSKPLPYSGFKWVKDFPEFEMMPKLWGIGRFYEVDLEYPKELHDLHSEYPCAPEKIEVKKDMLSDYCIGIKKRFNIADSKVKKLMTTLYDKENYVVHERLLEYYLELGLKLKKVHKVLEFRERPWLQEYIQFNTDMRTKAKNDFEKDFFKLMNNSVYGKTMEDVRKRCNVKLETDYEHFLKLTEKPYYSGCKIFSKDLVAVNMRKKEITVDKPIYCGVAILELSKLLMYKFHYGTIKPLYGDKAKLLFTDTDSLMYEIETEDVYEDLFQFRDQLDNHKYPEGSKFKFIENKQVIGKFKDETAGKPIKEFIGLKSKMYSYIVEDKDKKVEKIKAKGVKKYLIDNDYPKERYFNFSHFEETLNEEKIMRNEMKCMRTDRHEMFNIKMNKISLSCYDDKRYVLDKVNTLAYGHYKI